MADHPALTVTISMHGPNLQVVAPGSTVVQTIADRVAEYFEQARGEGWCTDAIVHVQCPAAPRPPFPSKAALGEGREGIAFVDRDEEVP